MVSESFAPGGSTMHAKHNAKALATDLGKRSDEAIVTLKATDTYPFNSDAV
jgi:hypothetical protein